MKEERIRARLVRIYTVTAAGVLFAALSLMALLFYRDAAAQNRESFSTLLFAVTDQLRLEYAVSHPSLRELERKNRLMLSLRDNGERLLYNSGDSPEAQTLFSRVERLAEDEGYAVSVPPLTGSRRTSPIYALRENGRAYLGAVSIIPFDPGYRSVTLVQQASPVGAGKIALLIIGYLIGLALLCVVGVRLIDRALLPAAESRKRQTRFIAAASHELRSPLAVIAANASTLRAKSSAPAAAAAIESECARMSRLIGDMLLLAATDAEDWPVTLNVTEVDTVLLEAYEAHAPLFQQNGCTLALRLPEEPLPRVTADGARLAQVLAILLDNALSYGMTRTNKSAELAAARCGRGLSITVTDHGAGLTDGQKTQVFERFYRGDASRREKQHFGLGLSIAYELIRLQNGSLCVEDTPGGGCTFCIRL